MKQAKWLAMGILLLTGSASAQEKPKAEVSVGYSYLRLGGSNGVNQQGGSTSIAANLNRWFGIVGDFGGYHAFSSGASLDTYTFLFGPRFSLRRQGRVIPFAQVLLGGAHVTASGGGFSGGTTPLAISGGGGVDLRVSQHLALRPQVDYLALRSQGATLNSVRASFGIVFRFGGK
jgi:hypothetical protein